MTSPLGQGGGGQSTHPTTNNNEIKIFRRRGNRHHGVPGWSTQSRRRAGWVRAVGSQDCRRSGRIHGSFTFFWG